MDRRTVLALGGVALSTSFGGCLGSLTDPFGGSAVERREHPSRPDELTSETVVSFVEEYEEVTQHNQEVSDETTDISLHCSAAIDIDGSNEYYLVTNCTGSKTIEDDSGRSVGEIATVPVFYEVSSDRVVRAERTERAPGSESDDHDDSTVGVRVGNFSGDRRSATLTVADSAESDRDPPVTEQFSLEHAAYIEHRTVVREHGTYRLTIALDDGSDEQYEWDVSTLDPSIGVNVYLLSDGDIAFGTRDGP